MYQSARQSFLKRVPQDSTAWRVLRACYQPVSWAIGAAYRPLSSRRFPSPPIIIGGAPRSGTTLLLSVLSAHPHIWAIEHETSAFCPPRMGKASVSPADFELHRVFAPLALSRPPETCSRWCEKTPGNIRSFGALLEYFGPDVRLIHIVRDGRDSTSSRHLRNRTTYYYSPSTWAEIVSEALRFRGHPQVVLVRYEDLVLDFSQTIGQICEFLDEPLDPQVLDWYRYASVRTHPAWRGSVTAMTDSSIGRWRRPEHAQQVDRFMQDDRAVALLAELGYDRTPPRPVSPPQGAAQNS